MSESTGKMQYFDKTPDDLKLIHGIGPKLEDRLLNAGILHYDQLAAYSPDEIVLVLGKLIGGVEKINQENWIGQAKKLAEESMKVDPARSDLLDSIEERLHYASYKIEFLLDDGSNVRRTRINYIQNANQDSWAGWDQERLVAYIVRSSGMRNPCNEFQPLKSRLDQPDSEKETDERNVSLPESGTFFGVSELFPMVDGENKPYMAVPQDRGLSFGMKLKFALSPKYFGRKLAYIASVGYRKNGSGSAQIVGRVQGELLIAESVSIQVPGQPIPAGVYRMIATVELAPETQKTTGTDQRKIEFTGGLLHVY
jgi:hypothetical protein